MSELRFERYNDPQTKQTIVRGTDLSGHPFSIIIDPKAGKITVRGNMDGDNFDEKVIATRDGQLTLDDDLKIRPLNAPALAKELITMGNTFAKDIDYPESMQILGRARSAMITPSR